MAYNHSLSNLGDLSLATAHFNQVDMASGMARTPFRRMWHVQWCTVNSAFVCLYAVSLSAVQPAAQVANLSPNNC